MQYDRPLFRTTRTLTILLAVCLSLMFALVTIGSIRAQRSPWEFWPVYLYIVCTPLAVTTKTLSVLWEYEKSLTEPSPLMEYVFTLALLLPIVAGLIPVGLIMRFAR